MLWDISGFNQSYLLLFKIRLISKLIVTLLDIWRYALDVSEVCHFVLLLVLVLKRNHFNEGGSWINILNYIIIRLSDYFLINLLQFVKFNIGEGEMGIEGFIHYWFVDIEWVILFILIKNCILQDRSYYIHIWLWYWFSW